MNKKILGYGLLAFVALATVPTYCALAETTDEKELWGANMDSTFAVTAVQDTNKNWAVHFVNSSKDTYNLTVQVDQFNSEHQKISSKTMSARLAPEQILDKPLRAATGMTNCEVKLRNWSKVEKKQTSSDIDSKIEALKEQIAELEKQK